jgi:hypothetical protein
VATVADWVLAEFVRLFHNVPADEAQALVDGLVTRLAPTIQDFDGFLKVLATHLGPAERALVQLYQRGQEGATYAELAAWAHPRSRANLRRTLAGLVNDKAFVHEARDRFVITRSGQREVEGKELLRPSDLPG